MICKNQKLSVSTVIVLAHLSERFIVEGIVSHNCCWVFCISIVIVVAKLSEWFTVELILKLDINHNFLLAATLVVCDNLCKQLDPDQDRQNICPYLAGSKPFSG